MKLFKSLLFQTTLASHFRGSTWLTSFDANGNLQIDNPQAWRKGASGFPDSCSAAEISNQTVSNSVGTWTCTYLADSTSCGTGSITYKPTFGDDTLDYCYGFGKIVISPAPTSPYELEWTGGNWVSFTTDRGSSIGGSGWSVQGKYYEILNSAPSFKLPPIWMIKAKCDGEFIALNPTDADGDIVKCRWATQSEASSAYYQQSLWPSLSIDQDNCVVHYNGTLDSHGQGVKPIALTIEDFDVNGNIKSSTPIQFLAQVWTPNVSSRSLVPSMRIQTTEIYNDCWPNCYPVIPDDGDDEDEDNIGGRKKREALLPEPRNSPASYCDPLTAPVWDDSIVPLDGVELDVINNQVTITLAAISQNAGIAVYEYQGPLGFQCGAIDQNMNSQCQWTLSPSQQKIERHQLCFQAKDKAGLQTERRCIVLKTRKFYSNIREMALEELNGNSGSFQISDLTDYGCAGRGFLDAYENTIGKHQDSSDEDFFKWKKCVQCANGPKTRNMSPLPEYVFWVDNASCTGPSAKEIAICECDRNLIVNLKSSTPSSSLPNFPANNCTKATVIHQTECCMLPNGLYDIFNPTVHCCNATGIHQIGSC